MTGRSAAFLVLLISTSAVRALAQDGKPADLAARGLAAYRSLDYEKAAEWLRLSLIAGRTATSPDSARATTWIYLGATDVFRGRLDSAKADFHSALAADPRVRADTLIFPPPVTTAFEAVRQSTGFVWIVVPPDTTLAVDAKYPIRIFASAPHAATVDITAGEGGTPTKLFAGVLGDTLDVAWDPRGATGPVSLRVSVRPDSGSHRETTVPLTITRLAVDTLRWPVPPPNRPATQAVPRLEPPHYGSLAAGLGTGLGAVFLPKLIASDRAGGSPRYFVGASLMLAGIFGFVTQTRTPKVVDQPVGDPAATTRWRHAVDSVHAENERRRGTERRRITAGTAKSSGS